MCTGAEVAVLAGSAIQAGGGIGQANAQADALNQQADYANNAADHAEARGEFQVQRIRRELHRITGTQRASYAGQGVVVSDGSALEKQMDTAGLAEEDVMQAQNNAALEAWGFKVQAYNYEYQADAAQ